MKKARNPCKCGSGKERYALKDAAGIFCDYVCEACESRERKRWNPQIFVEGSPYSRSGDEDDIPMEFK